MPELCNSGPVEIDAAQGGQTATKKLARKRKRTSAEVPEEEQPKFAPWDRNVDSTAYGSLEHKLHDEIVAFVSYILPTPQERTVRQQAFLGISGVLEKCFPNAEIKLFGSVAHDLCLPNGDLDICVRLPDIKQAQIKKTLFRMSDTLKSAGICTEANVNFWAKVPVILLTTSHGLGPFFKADISINNLDGVQVIAAINGYLKDMPALKPLIMVVKAFLSQRKLNSAASSGLSSYALIYLNKMWPPICPRTKLNPCNRPFDFITKPMVKKSLGALVIDFFFYYGSEFPYATSYISVPEGQLLPKTNAPWIKNPDTDKLVIQCLARPDNDVARSAGRIEEIRAAFRDAFTTLKGIPFPSPIGAGLSFIILLSQVTLDHREHVRDIVDSGQLDATLARLRNTHLRSGLTQRYGQSNVAIGSSSQQPAAKRPRYNR